MKSKFNSLVVCLALKGYIYPFKDKCHGSGEIGINKNIQANLYPLILMVE